MQQLNIFNSVLAHHKYMLVILGSATLLTLSGCVQQSSLMPKTDIAVDQAQAFHQQQQNFLQQHPEFHQESLPQQWWQLFNDPVLTQLQQQLAQSNPDNQIALLKIEESQAALGQINASLQPQISLDADYSRSAISQHIPVAKLGASHHAYNLWSMGVQSSWELDLWGYLKHLRSAAQAGIDAKYYDQQQVKVSLSAELARHYFLLRGLQNQLTIQQQIYQLDLETIQIYQKKLHNGVATNADLATVTSQAIQAQQQLEQLTQQIDLVKNSITQMLGMAPKQLDSLLTSVTLPPLPSQIPIGLASDLVKYRPDILQADAELRAALENVQAAQADFYPRIGLTAQGGLQAFSLSDFGSWSSRQYAIGPTFHLPIFEGGKLKSTLALNETRQKIAAINYQKTVLNAWHEVDNALTDYQYNKTDAELLQQQLNQNQITQHVVNRNLEHGTVDRTQLINAQKQTLLTQSELIQNRSASALSIVALYRALGGEGAAQFSHQLVQEKR